jgi:hypothetical protein
LDDAQKMLEVDAFSGSGVHRGQIQSAERIVPKRGVHSLSFAVAPDRAALLDAVVDALRTRGLPRNVA